jgi:uncharacterized membrane protein
MIYPTLFLNPNKSSRMLKSILVTALTMLVLDAVWLTFRRSYHESLIKSVQGTISSIRIIPAILIYILLPASTTYFATNHSKTSVEALKNGAIFGASMYALYDLTNLATLKGWTMEMTIIDILWGTVICSVGAFSGYFMK